MSVDSSKQYRDFLTTTSQANERGDLEKPLDFRLMWRIALQMKKYPRLLTIAIVLAVLLAVLNGTIPFIMTETLRGPIESPASFEERFGVSSDTGIWVGVGVMVILAVIWYIVMRFRQFTVADLSEHTVRDLRNAIFAHLQILGMDYYDRTKVGRILARCTSDVDALRRAIAMVAPRMVLSVIQMVYAMIILFYYDLVLGGIVLAITPVFLFATQRIRQALSNSYRTVQESYSLITSNLAESIAGIHVTQAFVREDENLKMFDQLCRLHRDRHMRTAKYQGIYWPMIDVTGQVVIAIAILVGSYRVSIHAMSVGDLIGFMVFSAIFFQPVSVIAEMYNLTLQAMAGAERVFHLLDTEPAELAPKPENAIDLPRRDEGMRVAFDDVIFSYVPGRPVLKHISFDVEPGQTVAIVGKTGSGKTSIVSLIAKFYTHEQGVIRVDNIDIAAIQPGDLHSQMGLVSQENILFSGTVLDTIRFAKPDATDDEVYEVCRSLGCLDVLERLPKGLHTEVGERGGNLSLGQRQLACFARAMMANPRLIILDEATSAVDTVTEARVQEALERLIAGRTSFVVAHRLSTIRRADLLLVMQDGEIVERGTHESLLALNGLYADLHADFVRLSRGDSVL